MITAADQHEMVEKALLDVATINDATDITNPERRPRVVNIIRTLSNSLDEASSIRLRVRRVA